jgi:hypothetical protein
VDLDLRRAFSDRIRKWRRHAGDRHPGPASRTYQAPADWCGSYPLEEQEFDPEGGDLLSQCFEDPFQSKLGCGTGTRARE